MNENELYVVKEYKFDNPLSQHICEACGQIIPAAKDTRGPSSRN